jgi:hypothetical protein
MFTNRNTYILSADGTRGPLLDSAADEAFERYLDWRHESSGCESAYRHWVTTAHSRDGALAFATYKAALDREQQAAAQYEAAVSGRAGC